jgi:3-oxoacyl-[acyl-carrier protein] reductase
MGRLEGRTAIVTGAGRGIGRAIAETLGAEGANVVLNDLDAEPAQAAVAALEARGVAARAVPGDVTAADFPARAVGAALESFGGLDIVVNNAGYIWNTAVRNTTDAQWAAMLDVHAGAPFRLLREAGEHFRERAKAEIAEAGRARCRKVVNVSSVSGLYGAATQAAYASGKTAVLGLTRTLAKEWGRYNVCVNCVAFGYIETRLTQALTEGPRSIEVAGRSHGVGLPPERIEAIAARTPLGRAGTPEEAAGAVLLLCLPESDFITGQVLECSGGLGDAG